MIQIIKPKNRPAFRKLALYGMGSVLSLGLGYLFLTGSRFSQLIGFFAYMSVACSMLPLPTPPYVIALGQEFDPALVAVVGTIGNCVAAFFEYHIVSWFFSKSALQQRVESNRTYQKWARYFERAAFPCLLFSAFTPVPFEPFRLAAILMRYNLLMYLLAVLIGRLPRYYLMAQVGNIFTIPTSYLVIMLIVLLLLPLIALFTTERGAGGRGQGAGGKGQ